ncbi:helix-turn-helix transcriptional regulator [Nocardioides sp.]|uniref:helix-turn-helix transcriptional regulator n=1 Tax=Nocardioides sp. TaxID=35761 RepID=UPI0039E28312
MSKPKRYLSRPEVAERIGVKPDTLNRYKLPEPDAQIGARLVGWLPETIDRWNRSRPSRTVAGVTIETDN